MRASSISSQMCTVVLNWKQQGNYTWNKWHTFLSWLSMLWTNLFIQSILDTDYLKYQQITMISSYIKIHIISNAPTMMFTGKVLWVTVSTDLGQNSKRHKQYVSDKNIDQGNVFPSMPNVYILWWMFPLPIKCNMTELPNIHESPNRELEFWKSVT